MSGERVVGAVLVLAALAACTGGTTAPAAPSSVSPSRGAPTSPAAVASPTSPATPVSPTSVPIVRGELDLGLVLEVVEHLAADIGPRPAGSDADRAAREVVAAALADAGWVVTEEEVALPQGGSTANVVAVHDRGDLTRRHVVVGAHVDTVVGSPGANDDGTGVGILVALAAELADEVGALDLPVVLVGFGAEEYQPSDPREHHIGSAAYVARHGQHVVRMVSVDMVGDGPLLAVALEGRTTAVATSLAAAGEERGLDVEVLVRGDISDHGPFALAGIPAAFVWTGMVPTHHDPTDTVDRLDPDAIERAGTLVLHWLRGAGTRP